MSTKPKTNENEELSLLDKNYNIAKDSLDASKQRSQQNANVTLEKLKKYLPEYVKSQGMGGTGMSETSLLQAYSDYSRNMSDIESSYQQQHNELLSNYNTTKLEKETAAQDNLYQVEMTNLSNLYDSLKGTDGKISEDDYNKLSTYVDDIKGSIGDDNYNLAKTVLKGYKQNQRTTDEQTSFDALKPSIVQNIDFTDKISDCDGGEGDNFSFNNNGVRQYYEKGYVATEDIINALSSALGRPAQLGDMMTYNGVEYMYLPADGGGSLCWWSVENRKTATDVANTQKKVSDVKWVGAS